MEFYLSQIFLMGCNFAPRGSSTCSGQLLPIAQNSALFSLMGTAFGGDGRTTFGLPDLRGRAAIGQGQGPGLPSYNWGQKSGQHEVQLNTQNLPAHSHNINVNAGEGDTNSSAGSFLASTQEVQGFNSSADATLNTGSVANTGGGQAVNNMSPSLALYYCVATQGIFPSRN